MPTKGSLATDGIFWFFSPALAKRSYQHPIETAFATVRHHTKRSKGYLPGDGIVHMMCRLRERADERWKYLHNFYYLTKVITGIKFTGGIETNPNNKTAT
jgi:putative transposase